MLHPHHDGSELYLSNPQPRLGEEVVFRIRIPKSYDLDRALLRIFHDGEPRYFDLKKAGKDEDERWWSVKAPVINRRTRYRFLLIGKSGQTWLTARGLHDSDVTSATDFQLIADTPIPNWIFSSVFYQIFPDRFARSERRSRIRHNFIERPWTVRPKGRDKTTGIEYFGGDLYGVTERLDYLQDLGVNGIYFTPIFPAKSTHRYDASSFEKVDPLLGGNEALIELSKEAKARKIRLLGDLTTNHCGAGHPWLKTAQKKKNSVERGFFYWDKKIKHGYVGWWGIAGLPKLNFESNELRKRMFSSRQSILKRWLRQPYEFSGWRIDVGNMTGRYAQMDINQEIVEEIREVFTKEFPDAWLVAENADNHPEDLNGMGWHGTMNYNGFMRPLWSWLHNEPDIKYGFFGVPIAIPRFTGVQLMESLRNFQGMVPWISLNASMILLDSHDTARFRNVVGFDRGRHFAAIGLLMTYPGVPSIFAGDEIGVEGAWGEDARRTMPWTDESQWDKTLLKTFKQLIDLRRTSHALAFGGLRWIEAGDDYVIYERQSTKQHLGIVVTRRAIKINLPKHWKKIETFFGPEGTRRIKFTDAGVGIYQL